MMPNPPGGPFAGAMPSMPSMPSMSGALAAAQSKQQTFANLAPSYGTPPSPHSVLLTAKATADIDAVEILDMDQLDELVTEKIKLLETLKAVCARIQNSEQILTLSTARTSART